MSEVPKSEAKKGTKNEVDNKEVSETERELAQQAHADFVKGNYQASLNSINKLLLSRPNDTKVLMNKAVVEYYHSSLKKTDAFRKNISSICTKADLKINSDAQVSSDHSVVVLNHCIMQYHLHQYADAAKILDKMRVSLDTLEESVGIGVCLLLIECHLSMYEATQALNIIAHTEATFLPQPLPPQSSSPKQLQEKESKSPEKALASNETCSSTTSLNSNGSNNGNGQEEVKISTNSELRSKLHLLRIRAMLILRLVRVSKKELKTVNTQTSAPGCQSDLTVISMKSHVEYLKGNHVKAIKVLNQCKAVSPPSPSCGPRLGVMYYNNQAVIHFGLGKPTMAVYYLQKAFEELTLEQQTYDQHNPDEPLSNKTLYQLSCLVKPQICCNLGVALLHMKKPQPLRAFDFFLDTLDYYPHNARLWLRLAECCILAHSQGISESTSDIITGPHGYKSHSKVCINPSAASHTILVQGQEKFTNTSRHQPTLEFGRFCLMNALHLIPKNISGEAFTEEQESSGVIPDTFAVKPSSPMRNSEIQTLLDSCLACSAYISLCLQNYANAGSYSKLLISTQSKNPIYSFLGNMYIGEAMFHMGYSWVSETYFKSSQWQNNGLNLLPSNSQTEPAIMNAEHVEGWTPEKVMAYNLCVKNALEGKFELINEHLKTIASPVTSMPGHVIALLVYINIKQGNLIGAKKILLESRTLG